jgi:SMC interacting uncharacterized protein involved in chromosome segregation|nr:MAG TPA: Keratin [Caudoviricetes sp.]
MAINIKKYTKDQMAKMVEEAQEAAKKTNGCMNELRSRNSELELQVRTLKAKNAALAEQIDQMNGEAINKANEIANLKANADTLRMKLADTEAALVRANSEMAVLRHDLTCEQESSVHLASVCRWLSDHPWGNLWAWAKRKLGCAE